MHHEAQCTRDSSRRSTFGSPAGAQREGEGSRLLFDLILGLGVRYYRALWLRPQMSETGDDVVESVEDVRRGVAILPRDLLDL